MPNSAGVEVARISVKVSPDTSKFRSELKRQLEAIEKGLGAKLQVDVDVDPDTKGFRTKVKAQTEAATAGVKAKVKVEPETAGFAARMKEAFKKITSTLTEAPNFGSGINLTGYLVIAAALAAVLAPLAGLITSLLLALPGLISLIATPIAALSLGIDGLAKAAETLKAPFDELRNTMSQKVQEQFTPVFEQLRAIFPTLAASMPIVTQGMADIAGAIAGVVTDPKNMQLIGQVIGQIGTALSAAAPGIADFTQAILTLTASFGDQLPGLVEWFNGAMKSFNDFVGKMKETGQLDAVFKSLGEVLKVIVDTLGAIAKIGLDTLSDPKAMASFMVILKGVAAALIGCFQASKWFLSAVTTMMIAIMQFGAKMVVIWNQIVATITNFGNTVRAAMSGIWNGLVAVAQGVWNGITSAVQTAISTIQGIVSGVGAFIAGIWNGIVGAATAAWNGVVSAVQSAWNAIVSAIQSAVQTVISVVSALPGQIQAFFADAGSWLVSAGKAIIQGLINGIKSMVGAVKDAVGSVLGGIKNLIPHSPAKEGPFSGSGWTKVASGGAALATQFGDGFEQGFQSVLERAKALAGELKKAIDSGTDQNMFKDIGADDLKLMLAALEQEKKRIKIQKDSIPKEDKAGRAALQSQIDQLQAQKDILAYQEDRVKNEKAYGDAAGDDPFVKAASGLMKMPVDFAKATGKQFLSDLGINGDGFISKAITEGISYVFQIGSVDEAMSIKDREENKRALAVTGRQ